MQVDQHFVIVNDTVLLRPLVPADAQEIVPLADDQAVAKQLRDRFPHPYRLQDAEEFIRSQQHIDPPLVLAIVVEGHFAGTVGIVPGTDIHYRTAEIGYWLGQPYWGKGLMTSVLVAASQHFMDTYSLLRLFALPKSDNAASCRVLEKAGYGLEGILRKNYEKYGQTGDSSLYALIR